MATYICKLKKSKLGRKTYLSRIENHSFALKSSTNTNKKFRVGTKNRIGRVCGNKQLFSPYKLFFGLFGHISIKCFIKESRVINKAI